MLEKPEGMTYSRNAIYAVYRGDELLVTGTADECAAEMKVNPRYIHWLTTPTHKRRLAGRVNPEQATTAVVIDWEE